MIRSPSQSSSSTTRRSERPLPRVSGDSYEAGRMVGTSLADNGLRSIFVLSDGLGDNGSELARGINEHVDESVVVTGGLVGDGADFK